ncbi:hypothetical protein [Streptomyces olivaceoviridis]
MTTPTRNRATEGRAARPVRSRHRRLAPGLAATDLDNGATLKQTAARGA